jgi:hypothetical protein
VTGPLARDSLTIFIDGEETPGFIVYGLAPRGTRAPAAFPSAAWVANPRADESVLHGEAWEVKFWEVPMIIWPTGDEFVAAVRRTLGAMIDRDCRVAWIGAEGIPFCDPPQLFDPGCMSGGVLAWMTDDRRFQCPLRPDRALAPIADDQLLALRTHARGLADTT